MTNQPSPRVRRSVSLAALVIASGLSVPLLPGVAVAATSAPVTASSRHHDARVLDLPAGLRPEGITARHDTLYVSSLADGRILAVDRRSGHTRVLLPGQTGRALRGMQIDGRTGLLYAAGNRGATAVVLALDHRTGHIVREWTVPGAGFLNDLVITKKAVWVTDSRVDRLLRIPLGRGGHPQAGDPSLLPLVGAWPVPDPAAIRANGIRALPDGRLLLDHSSAGGLWAVSPSDGRVTPVPVTGGPAIIGGDGLELDGHRLWIVRGTGQRSVSELRLDVHHGRATARWVRDLTDASLDVPSTAVLSGGRLWAVNARFGVADPATAPYWITGLVLR